MFHTYSFITTKQKSIADVQKRKRKESKIIIREKQEEEMNKKIRK